MTTDDAPTRADLRAEEWEASRAPMPDWVRPPLHAERAVEWRGFPHETIRCAEHPAWWTGGDRQHVLYHARRHVEQQHASVA